MLKKIRDLAGTTAVLVVVFGVLILINPRVRDRAGQFAGEISGGDWSRPRGAISDVVRPAVDIVSNYASDNTYLFYFFVAAVVLLILMLRA